jgi:hypothetical protein
MCIVIQSLYLPKVTHVCELSEAASIVRFLIGTHCNSSAFLIMVNLSKLNQNRRKNLVCALRILCCNFQYLPDIAANYLM